MLIHMDKRLISQKLPDQVATLLSSHMEAHREAGEKGISYISQFLSDLAAHWHCTDLLDSFFF